MYWTKLKINYIIKLRRKDSQREVNMKTYKIAFTGGPCAGKTSIIKETRKYLKSLGYRVIVVNETATELISYGLLDKKHLSDKDIFSFQTILFNQQYNKELNAEKSLHYLCDKDVCIILFDRGIIDNKAYLKGQEEFDKILELNNCNELSLIENYDLVIDLMSLAVCDPKRYALDGVRFESIEEAIALDRRTTRAWLLHRNIEMFRSDISLEEESNLVINSITNFIDGKKTNNKDLYLVQTNREFNDENSKTVKVCETILNTSSRYYYSPDYVYKLLKREYKGNTEYRLITIKNGYVIEDRRITKELYDSNLFTGIKEEDIKEETTFYENDILYKYIIQNGVEMIEVDSSKEFIIPDNFTVYGKIDDYNKVRKYTLIKKPVL